MELIFQEKPYLITKLTEHISEGEIKSFFGEPLQDKIIELWQEFEEIGFNNVNIFGFEVAKEMNLLHEVEKYAPDFIMVGVSNGGEGIFIKKDCVDINVFYLSLGALGSVEMCPLGVNFFQWIQDGPCLEDEAEEMVEIEEDKHEIHLIILDCENYSKYISIVKKFTGDSMATIVDKIKNGKYVVTHHLNNQALQERLEKNRFKTLVDDLIGLGCQIQILEEVDGKLKEITLTQLDRRVKRGKEEKRDPIKNSLQNKNS